MKKKIIIIDDIEIDEDELDELDESFRVDGCEASVDEDEAPVAADNIDLVNRLIDECEKLLEQ